jgi:hypothetical protein
MTEAEKTDRSATPEARRVFAETHFAMDGWPSATPIRENVMRWMALRRTK